MRGAGALRPAKLTVQGPEGSAFTQELQDSETLIGRGAASDVRVQDKTISREHAAISWERDHYAIEDLQTTNGTRVNGKRIRSAELQDGDTIQIGQTMLTFRYN